MTSKRRTDYIGKILHSLKNAAAGDYSTKLDFASKDDELGLIADAVNTLLQKTGERLSAKQTPADLTEDTRRYRHILDSIEESYFEVDLKGNLNFFNQRVRLDLGYSKEELQGVKFIQLMDETNAGKVYEAFHQVFLTGKPIKGFDWEILKKNKEKIYVESSVALLHDEKGQPVGFRGIVRDISLRKKAEKALRRSEEKYRHILENMDETYLETDLKGNFIFFNDALCRIFGYSREELQNTSYRLTTPPETQQRIFENFNEIYRTGKTKTFINHAVKTKDGSIRLMEISIALLRSPAGEPIGFGGIGRDVTEKIEAEQKIKNSERHLRLITDNIRDIIWTLDFNLRWTYLSPSVFRITGFSLEEVINIPLKVMLPPETYAQIEQALAEELSKEARGPVPDEQRMAIFELPLMHKNGTRLWVEISAAFNRDEYSKPFEIVGVTRDISERKKTEVALRESEALHRKALETTSDGVSIIQDGKYVYLNPQFLKTMGLPDNYQISERLGSAMHPDDSKLMNYYYKKRLQGEPTPGIHDVRVIKPDQTLMYLQVTSVDIVYQGKPSLLSFMQDVTQRKRAENALKESEKRYRTIAENINDVVWTIDFNMQITYASPSNTRVTGYTPEEAQYISLKELLTPDSLTLAFRVLAEELARETSGQSFDPNRSRTLELEIHSKHGDSAWLEVNATFNRDANGKATEILAVGRNITERRNMEKALAESEQRYRMIVENMHDSISIMDLNFQYVYQSPSESRVTGFTPEEIMHIPTTDQMPPESYDLAEKTLARELELELSGKPVDPRRLITLELEVYHKNGGTLWEEVNATFQRDENGKPIGMILTSRDITARKKAELALAENEKRYRTMAENVNDVIWTIDLDLKFTYVSPSCTRVTGYTPEEARRTPLSQLLKPESYARATQRLADELALEKSGKAFDPNRAITVDIEAIHKDGSILWLEVTGTFNRNKKGEITEILLLGRNFTQRRKAEQALEDSEKRYRMIIENMHEIIWTTDLNFQYTYVSPSVWWVTGYTPEEIMRLPVDQLLTPDSLALAQNALTEELTREFSGEPVDLYRSRTIEQELHHKNGGRVWLDVTATFTRNDNNKPIGMLMACRDITARKKAEEENDKLEAQLVQAQKMEIVGRLAGGVAHDFNNMLSVILGYVDLAKMRLARQHPVLKDIAEIEKAAIRSRDITTQLLAFSRKQIIEPKIIDLNDLVKHTQKALIRLIGEDIDLKVVQEENLWAIMFDPSQIEQILINLAVNARDAMPGGGKLTIETANLILDDLYCLNHIGFTPGRYVRLSFSDNGVGMDKKTIQHIFEPFFTTKEVGKGTGLGLATVYGIVKQNTGFINVYSEPNHGTTFSIYLPRTSGEKEIQNESGEEPEIAGSGNILLVEDDPMVLEITQGMLESIGYKVTAAANPLDAISLFENLHTFFDLIITDVVMPGMSGKELRNKLNEIRPAVKVLFMSGYTADVIAHHGVLEEGVQFLQKPFTIKSLAGKVNEAIAVKLS
jgi:two-component system, cell cycle sensor histidine kinase and response regulator CckA